MHATRPRESILDLFDPLASQPPSRDAPSPDSDKENSSPPLSHDASMTAAFFKRTPKHASPVVLKRRLIDVGDVTVDDPSMLAMLTEEEELDESMCDDDDTLTLPTLPSKTPARIAIINDAHSSTVTTRTPLGEISLEREITPMAQTKMYKRPPPTLHSTPSIIIPASTDVSSIDSVINAVNASDASFASPGPANTSIHFSDPQPLHDLPGDTDMPQITISAADELSESLSALHLDPPTKTLSGDVSRPSVSSPLAQSSEASPSQLHPGLRPQRLSGSPHRDNRLSIDLCSSFHLQMQSAEASFDLLNDKISFFSSTGGMDSFLSSMEEDESFDMAVEEAKLHQAIARIQEEEANERGKVPTEDAGPEVASTVADENAIPVDASPSPTEDPQTVLTPSKSPTVSKTSTPTSPTFMFGLPRLKVKTPSPVRAPVTAAVFVPPSPEQPTIANANVCTPAPLPREPVAPVPVPALRIVKRAARRPGHEKANTSIRAGPTETPQEVPEPVAAPQKPAAPPITRRISALASGVASRVVSSGRVASATAAAAMRPTGSGPRRVPVAEGQPATIGNRSGAGSQKVLPPGLTGGPRRVVVAPPAPPAAPAPAPNKLPTAPAASGLKAPVKYATIGASALPRPAIRLPAASGIARPRLAAGSGASAASGGAVGQAGRAGSSRRMAYGGQ
ncbi:hypothetical protein H0H81_007486 [Sphagnurus paluster]|uniref:Uncharacterized protein n=1 Tax=Sphagnurus paluster TaxID=117069 RepID=A0A9P7GWK9_9AGAR|nr:hypothetical protein H0H81_007486 [Sphagnurus paluster]